MKMSLYQSELLRKLSAHDCSAQFDEETGLLHISYQDHPVCAQNAQGILRYESEWHEDEDIRDCYQAIEDEVAVIREYVKLYERSPQMPFPSIKEYRMLGEMGDVVFGAKHSENFGFTFPLGIRTRNTNRLLSETIAEIMKAPRKPLPFEQDS